MLFFPGSSSGWPEQLFHVTLIDIRTDMMGDNVGVGFQSIQVPVSHIGCDLVANVKQLAEIRIV